MIWDQRVQDRFWRRVVEDGECWRWTGAYTIPQGYGRFMIAGKYHYVHRFSWETFHGEIPDALQIDHRCRVRLCVRPDHLEPVTCRINLRRGEHPNMIAARTDTCKRGHSLLDAHVYRNRRYCRHCPGARDRERQARNRAA